MVVMLVLAGLVAAENDGSSVDQAALERTRQKVQLLDDAYKFAVVAITNRYVEMQSEAPAALTAKDVFEAMHKKGWHSSRLIDVTGKPKNKDNSAKTDFEKRAAEAIKNGKPYLDELGTKNGKKVLRAATVVPAVMKQCAVCHGGKENRILGAITYELPIK
ncbi:MAG: DUF3365 domain-containing protein [Gemmataceae bacterium]